MENPFESPQNKPLRPTFLLVLCILTFIGSGWGVLSNLFSLFTAGIINSAMEMQQYSSMVGEVQNEGMDFLSGILNSSMQAMQARFMHGHEIAIFNIVLNLISLVGAILMFQLHRLGFYLYVAAQILMLFVIPYFTGFSFVIVVGMLFSGFISLIFIILYALNLKYMKN